MRNKIIVTSAFSAAVLGWITMVILSAQPLDKRTFFTFSAPVAVPGEFIYPKEQARRLARNASNPVLTTRQDTKTAEQTNTDDLARISSTGQESATSAADKPTPSAPSGRAQQGEAAPESISIKPPKVPNQSNGGPK